MVRKRTLDNHLETAAERTGLDSVPVYAFGPNARAGVYDAKSDSNRTESLHVGGQLGIYAFGGSLTYIASTDIGPGFRLFFTTVAILTLLTGVRYTLKSISWY